MVEEQPFKLIVSGSNPDYTAQGSNLTTRLPLHPLTGYSESLTRYSRLTY